MEWVYPKIKEYCKERHGLEFQVRRITLTTTLTEIFCFLVQFLGGGHEVGGQR